MRRRTEEEMGEKQRSRGRAEERRGGVEEEGTGERKR